MSNQANPITAAKAIAAFVQDGWTRGTPSAFRGLMYVPVKVGSRSPITVYEANRGQFEGDCQVLVCVAEGDKGLAPLRDRLAAFAAKNDLAGCEDPGDSRKKGFKMTCTQVIMALEGAVSVVSDHKPKAKQSDDDDVPPPPPPPAPKAVVHVALASGQTAKVSREEAEAMLADGRAYSAYVNGAWGTKL